MVETTLTVWLAKPSQVSAYALYAALFRYFRPKHQEPVVTNLDQAATSLSLHLFGAERTTLGSVGQKLPAILVVFINAPRESWTGPTPSTWTRYKFHVEWHFDLARNPQL